jgi:hypothetical protein
VVSNVTAGGEDDSASLSSSTSTLKEKDASTPAKQNTKNKITINSYVSAGVGDSPEDGQVERAVLTLDPLTHSLASEWLDGLLMLLNQAPITAETSKLVGLVVDYGLKIRLLNVRVDDGMEAGQGKGLIPTREGLDEDYYYEV